MAGKKGAKKDNVSPDRDAPPSLLWRLLDLVVWLLTLAGVGYAASWAYDYRIVHIRRDGPHITGFDPWFNYRATQYLAENGWSRFFTWFDHKSWYPLGRPVSTTIYPAMQIAAVWIWRALAYATALYGYKPKSTPRSPGGDFEYEKALNYPFWTLEEVCCYMPAWFGAASSIFIGCLAYEAFNRSRAALVAGAFIMAILPAHLQRSGGGDFDNESVAITFMCAAFWLWTRSLRTPKSWPIACAAGVAYACMAASWGGYVLALNVVGIHACLLLFMSMFIYDYRPIYLAYTCFFVFGTFGATRVPAIAWTPFRSAEQLGPLGLFIVFQFVTACRHFRHRIKLPKLLPEATFCAIVVAVVAILIQSGSVAPFSARIRALFIESATRTGNPLVDSVSEHQPASQSAIWRNCHYAGYAAGLGTFMLPLEAVRRRSFLSPAASFLLVFGAICFFFSLKMSRLICLLGPSCSVLAGVGIGGAIQLALLPFRNVPRDFRTTALKPYGYPCRLIGILFACAAGYYLLPYWKDFKSHCDSNAAWSPAESQKKPFRRGRGRERFDNTREGYLWLRHNTPLDARIMAWWDYGYEITGVGNRTSLADGNTWNQEQIALIGLCLSSATRTSHRIIRHIADYILIKTLGRGDLGISTHFARISNSVHSEQCGEIDCDQYGFYTDGSPTPMMNASLVYDIIHGTEPQDLFKEVFKNNAMRILKVLKVSKESRRWAADPGNRLCDAPGSWYCPGQYPPLLRQLINPAGKGAKPDPSDSKEAQAFRQERAEHAEARRKEFPLPNGPNLPPGSYKNSCNGCNMETYVPSDGKGKRTRLRCTHCRSGGAAASMSVFENPKSCDTHFDNVQGQLQCAPKPNAPDVPRGPYTNSCGGCRLKAKGSKVECTHCETGNAGRRSAEFILSRCPPPGMLNNNNGFLVCDGLPNARNIPMGGYRDSCNGCAMEDAGVLRCTYCNRADGQQVEGRINLDSCGQGTGIDNHDGRLVCR